MKKELVEEMKQEQKAKVKFEDFSLKPFEVDDFKRKEALILDSIKKGEVPPEMISGEIKLQFDEGVNLPQIVGKPIPFIGMTLTSYTQDGQKQEAKLNSNPCPNFQQNLNFNTAVRIPMINKDKNKQSDVILLEYFMQPLSETNEL